MTSTCPKDHLGNELHVGDELLSNDGRGPLVARIESIKGDRICFSRWEPGQVREVAGHLSVSDFASPGCGWVKSTESQMSVGDKVELTTNGIRKAPEHLLGKVGVATRLMPKSVVVLCENVELRWPTHYWRRASSPSTTARNAEGRPQ